MTCRTDFLVREVIDERGAMAKKVNRKKQLKKEKRNQKVVSIHDYEDDFFLDDFLENDFGFEDHSEEEEISNQLSTFDLERLALMQYIEEHGYPKDYYSVMAHIEHLLNHPENFKAEYRELIEILDAEGSDERTELLNQYTRKYPHSLSAKYALLVETMNPMDVFEIERINALCEEAKTAWKKVHFPDYSRIEHQEKLDILCFAIYFFQTQGMLGRALDLIQYIEARRLKQYPPRFVRMMLTIYNQLFRYDLLLAYYQRAKRENKVDDSLLFHMGVAEFLQGNLEKAEDHLQELRELNPYTDELFADISWVDDADGMEVELEFYLPNSRESLQLALVPMWSFMAQRPLLLEFLQEQFDVEEDFGISLSDDFSLFSLAASPECEGIGWDKVRTFNLEAGITEAADFAKYSEKDLLALKGIGPVTIKKLKENGVVFKK